MATITEDYVSFETAKLLKDKGFDWCTHAYYEDEDNPNISLRASKAINWNKTEFISKPTLQMAMKWLREVHKIIITIDYNDDGDCEENERWGYSVFNPYRKVDHATYVTYEETVETAIKYCLENLI